jgi:four helix bundle protein
VNRTYHDLVVWQRAVDLVPSVYVLLKAFPPEENFALAAQIRRAVVSIPANIAEGQEREHKKEFAHHLAFAKGSLAELETLLIIAEKLHYITEDQLLSTRTAIAEIRRPLKGLLKAISTTRNPEPGTRNREATAHA